MPPEAENYEVAVGEAEEQETPECDSLEKAAELRALAQELLANDRERAVEVFSVIVEFYAKKYGEAAPECLEAYYDYGFALVRHLQDGGALLHDDGEDAPPEAIEDSKTDSGIAWQVLDACRVILESRLSAASDTEARKALELRIADVRALLGELGLADENWQLAIEELQKARALCEPNVQPDDRRLMHILFQTAIGHENNEQPAQALEYLRIVQGVYSNRTDAESQAIAKEVQEKIQVLEEELHVPTEEREKVKRMLDETLTEVRAQIPAVRKQFTAEDISSMSLKELRSITGELQIDTSGFLEAQDYREAVAKALAEPVPTPAPIISSAPVPAELSSAATKLVPRSRKPAATTTANTESMTLPTEEEEKEAPAAKRARLEPEVTQAART